MKRKLKLLSLPVMRCNDCGFVISILEWKALKVAMNCPRCNGNSFAKATRP